MKKMSMVAASLVCAFAACGQESLKPVMPTAGWTREMYLPRLDWQLAQIRSNDTFDVVFVGDSITHFFETGNGKDIWDRTFVKGKYRGLNLGVSGDRTEQVLWRFDNGVLDGYTAKAFVVMIGTNNIGHQGPEFAPSGDVVVGVKAVVDRIRKAHPESKVILTAIFPRDRTEDAMNRQRVAVVNRELRKFANEQTVFWMDLTSELTEPDGTISREMMPDYLHPARPGYEIWAKRVVAKLDKIVGGEGRLAGEQSWPCFWTQSPCRHVEKREKVWQNVDGYFDAVLLGDSITHGIDDYGKLIPQMRTTLGDYNILNAGFGGIRTQHLIWLIENGILDGYKTKLIQVLIGTNNTGQSNEAPEATARGIKRILALCREKQPEAKILLLAPLPREGSVTNKHCVMNREIAKLIKPMADGKGVLWLDLWDQFSPGGETPKELLGDLLHPTVKGYDIWANAVAPIFREVCGKGHATKGVANYAVGKKRNELKPMPAIAGTAPAGDAKKAMADFKAGIADGSPVVFVGDGSVAGWLEGGRESWDRWFVQDSPIRATNLGFNGCRTENLVWLLNGGAFDNAQSKVFVVGVGDENLKARANETVLDTVGAIWTIVARIRKLAPKAKIVLMPLKDAKRGAEINETIERTICNGQTILWCTPAGEGYAGIVKSLIPTLREAMAVPDLPAAAIPAVGTDVWPHLKSVRNGIWTGARYYDAVIFGDVYARGWFDQSFAKGLLEEAYPERTFLNLGDIEWSNSTERMLWLAKHGGFFDGYQTRAVLLTYSAHCDQWSGVKPTTRVEGIKEIIRAIREKQPQANILLAPVFPFGSTTNDARRTSWEAANALLAKLPEDASVTCPKRGPGKVVYLGDELYRKYLEKDGAITTTLYGKGWYMNREGFKVWLDYMRPIMDEAFGPSRPAKKEAAK